MFGDLSKSIEEGQERWGKIEKLQGKLYDNLAEGEEIPTVLLLLKLLVDHMRPMNPSQEQIDEATSGLADLLKALKK